MDDSVKVLVIGDTHFKVSNVKETDLMIESIIKVANNKRPDFIVLLGDTLDRHEIIHVSPLTRSVNFLRKLMDISPTYLLIGNHDLKNNRQFLSSEHPFVSLKYWGSNMIVVDTTTLVRVNNKIFVFVPYVPPGRFQEALDQCKEWKQAVSIFAHQEFRGAKMGPIISTEGDVWPLSNPLVISGHIHEFQLLQPNILYVGTPIQHSFGEDINKTISFFTFYHQKYIHERINLNVLRKEIVRITCSEVNNFIPKDNCDLKIIISGVSNEIKSIIKHPNIDEWKRKGIKIVYKEVPLDKQVRSFNTLKFSNVLYNLISNNPNLVKLYRTIFGNIN